MSTPLPLVATGVIRLDRDTELPLYVHADGIRVLKTADRPGRFFDHITAGRQAKVQGNGQMVFSNLLTTPEAISFPAVLEYNSQELTLTVEQKAAFSQLPNAHFKDLKVVFTETKGGDLALQEAKVTLMLMGKAIPLVGSLGAQGITFGLATDEIAELDLPHIGKAEIDRISVQVEAKRREGLQLLYNFGESEGDKIYDHSAESPGNDVKIKNARRKKGAIILTRRSDVASPGNVNSVLKMMDTRNEFTFEMWVKPTTTTVNKKGTILGIGDERVDKNYFLIEQERDGSLVISGDYMLSPTPFNGESLKAKELVHIVFTHNAQGEEKIYLNGELSSERKINGAMHSILSPPYTLTLGNKPNGKNPWQGEFHHLALYNRPLSEEEIKRNVRPVIRMAGNFLINKGPAPLDQPLPALFNLVQEHPEVQVRQQSELVVRPELRFTNLDLRYLQTEPAKWTLIGGVDASFWRNKTSLQARLEGSGTNPRLAFSGQQVNLGLDDWGRLEFTELNLEVAGQRGGDWRLSTTAESPFVVLPRLRFRAFDVFADFLMETYNLSLSRKHLLLNGSWLEERLAFFGTRPQNKGLIMQADADFEMLFDVDIPPIFDPQTGEKLSDGIVRTAHDHNDNGGEKQTEDGKPFDENRQLINVHLDLELRRTGLLTDVSSDFNWQDQEGVEQHTVVPGFTLFTPPPNKNAILETINKTVKENIHEIFERTGKQLTEYQLGIGTEQPKITLISNGAPTASSDTMLPGTFPDFTSSNSVFTLSSDGVNSKLSIAATGKAQADIDLDFKALIAEMANQNVSMGAISLLRRRIAERLALPYDRVLPYYYGFDAEKNFIDLQAGMRLRIDFQQYQFVQASDQSARRGFAGTGSTYVQLVSYTRKLSDGSFKQVLGFDPFLAQLKTDGSIDISNQGAGGLFDLLKPENRKAAYRLFFPLNPSSGLGPERVATIIGADSMAELQAATDDFDPDANIAPGDGISFFFRGKAIITPEIQVFVKDQAIHVPVGTTLRQLIECYDDLPQAGLGKQDLSGFLTNGKPLRLTHDGPDSSPAYRFINFLDNTAINNMDVLDLPLVKGDRFYF